MQIIFKNNEERQHFQKMLDFALIAEGLKGNSEVLQAYADTEANPRDEKDVLEAIVKIKEEHLKRVFSFLRALKSVVGIAKGRRPEDSVEDDRDIAVRGFVDFVDHSMVWEGIFTMGMILHKNHDRPWASEWGTHS